MKTLLKWFKYVAGAALYAFGHWALTETIFWGVADGDVLTASLLNAGYIIVFVLLEKVEIYVCKKVKARNTGREPGLLLRLYYSYMSGASFKSALYLFYFVVLVYATIDMASPEVFSDGFSNYLQSVQYGVLLLLAADTFNAQLSKDVAEDENTKKRG